MLTKLLFKILKNALVGAKKKRLKICKMVKI